MVRVVRAAGVPAVSAGSTPGAAAPPLSRTTFPRKRGGQYTLAVAGYARQGGKLPCGGESAGGYLRLNLPRSPADVTSLGTVPPGRSRAVVSGLVSWSGC